MGELHLRNNGSDRPCYRPDSGTLVGRHIDRGKTGQTRDNEGKRRMAEQRTGAVVWNGGVRNDCRGDLRSNGLPVVAAAGSIDRFRTSASNRRKAKGVRR